MSRTVFLIGMGALLGSLMVPAPLRAQAKKEIPPVANPDLPVQDEGRVAPDGEIETYDMSSSVKTDSMGLFLPDETWKRIKTGLPKMKNGTWVKYQIEHPELNLGTLRISVVPQSGLPTPRWRIVEILSIDATGDRTYIKAAFDRPSTDLRKARGLTFKAASLPPMVIPIGSPDGEEANALTVQIDQSKPTPIKVKYLGKKTLTVPAGTFETWHYRISGTKAEDDTPFSTEIWFEITGTVPVFRVVKMHQNKTTVLLVDKGEGAKSDLPPMSVVTPQGMGKEKTK